MEIEYSIQNGSWIRIIDLMELAAHLKLHIGRTFKTGGSFVLR